MIDSENLLVNKTAKVKEIFASIQGEGPYMGANQLFVRFCNCNLRCNYCDTDFEGECDEFTSQELLEEVKRFDSDIIHSVSLTGGEPLLSADFLKEFLPLLKDYGLKIYLETNASLTDELAKIVDFVDIVSADIKLESATGLKNLFEKHDRFFEIAKGCETFAKVVFDEKITDSEIDKCVELAQKHNILLVLQPKMNGVVMSVSSDFAAEIMEKFLKKYPNVRLIPQVHKFLAVR